MAKQNEAALRRVAMNILNGISFFEDKDRLGTFYAEIKCGKNSEIFPITSKKFLAYLRIEFRKRCNVSQNYDFTDVLVQKTDEVAWQQKPKRLYTRMAPATDSILYFLADEERKSVLITQNGWKVVRQSKVKFLKTETNKKQTTPVGGGDLMELLRPFVNMNDRSFRLFVLYLVQCFFPKSSHFLAVISSMMGSGKSTLTKLFQELVDPTEVVNTILPTTVDNILNLFANNKVVTFDNTQKLPDSVSDIFCTAVTGGTYTKRKFYTDNEQILLKLKNIIILNGINILPDRSDLRERSILFELKPIDAKKRRTEASLWEDFKKSKSQILGAIFDTMVEAMKIKNELVIEKSHRMCDAYREMAAIVVALGFTLEEFEELFEENRTRIDELHCNTNALCDIIDDYMERRQYKPVSGRVSEVYKDIYHSMPQKDSALPKSPSAFSRKIKEEQENLNKRGYIVQFPGAKRDGTYLTIEKKKK